MVVPNLKFIHFTLIFNLLIQIKENYFQIIYLRFINTVTSYITRKIKMIK